MITTLKSVIRKIVGYHPSAINKDAPEAYDLWAISYDEQPDNLMLALDEELFKKLLEPVTIYNKSVADIGCGTGRHWREIHEKEPGQLTGFDVSQGMLNKLQAKYPGSEVKKIDNNLFSEIPDQSYDMIISTLTIAHIVDIDEAITSWCRILKPSADIIITDFHPEALARGGSRTFSHGYQQISVNNHVHTLDALRDKFRTHGFLMMKEEHKRIDDTVRHYYEKQRALDIFEKFHGVPMIYGMHLKRVDDTE